MARGINYVVICLLLLGLRGSFESGAAAPHCFLNSPAYSFERLPSSPFPRGSRRNHNRQRRLPAEELHSVKTQRLNSSRRNIDVYKYIHTYSLLPAPLFSGGVKRLQLPIARSLARSPLGGTRWRAHARRHRTDARFERRECRLGARRAQTPPPFPSHVITVGILEPFVAPGD